MNMRRISAVALKEWRETTRDRLFLGLAFLMPALWLMVFFSVRVSWATVFCSPGMYMTGS